MKVINFTGANQAEVISAALSVLNQAGLVIFPTETTYGAGVLATSAAAVYKLLEFKAKREGKPLSIAVSDQQMAEQYVEINKQAANLYQQFLPGPLTIVSRDLGKLTPGVASEFGTVGVRIPDFQLIRELVAKLGAPITATSANPSGGSRPYSRSDIERQLSQKQLQLIDLFIDAGRLPPRPPSTVIDTTASAPLVFRQGALKINHQSGTTTSWQLTSDSPLETQAIAGKLLLKVWAARARRPLIFYLAGALGAGKTQFAKGIAKFLAIDPNIVRSPTYTYLQEYLYQRQTASGKLFHLDAWKVQDLADLKSFQLESVLQPGNILVIEWGQQGEEYLLDIFCRSNAQFTQVTIATTANPDQRLLTITEPSENSNPISKKLNSK